MPPIDDEIEKRPSVLKTTASYIIVTEFCERLAYYGFAGSLVLFFETKLNMSNEDSVNAFYLWNGAVYVTPLIGGYIADTILGRYLTILIFSLIYVVGLVLFILGEIPGRIQPALVFTGMYVVALGAGGIKPNCSTMGADQFDQRYEQDQKESKKFFSFFYWSINLGALVAYTLIAYVCQYGFPFLGGPGWGFFAGYMIPTIMLSVGVAIFMSGSRLYKKNSPQGSMITVALGIVWAAICGIFSSSATTTQEDSSKLLDAAQHEEICATNSDDSDERDGWTTFSDGERTVAFREVRVVLPNSDGVSETVRVPLMNSALWLDRASAGKGGNYTVFQVESVKYVARLVPFLAVMIPYWGTYGQTKTAFQIQGCQMD